MEDGRAPIEIWFMMTQWELDRTSARAMFCCRLHLISSVFHAVRSEGIFLQRSEMVCKSTHMYDRVNKYTAKYFTV